MGRLNQVRWLTNAKHGGKCRGDVRVSSRWASEQVDLLCRSGDWHPKLAYCVPIPRWNVPFQQKGGGTVTDVGWTHTYYIMRRIYFMAFVAVLQSNRFHSMLRQYSTWEQAVEWADKWPSGSQLVALSPYPSPQLHCARHSAQPTLVCPTCDDISYATNLFAMTVSTTHDTTKEHNTVIEEDCIPWRSYDRHCEILVSGTSSKVCSSCFTFAVWQCVLLRPNKWDFFAIDGRPLPGARMMAMEQQGGCVAKCPLFLTHTNREAG